MDDNQQAPPSIFRPRARIMKTLGEELISNDTVAIIELVKNAYDADAKDVLIKFDDDLEEGKGFIEVIDNGVGMDINTIRNAWMEPATPTKKKDKSSPNGSRRVLGEKGVGRFAASRLANSLELISRKSASSNEVYAFFDWTQFDDEEKFLDEIKIETSVRAPEEILPNDFFDLKGPAQGTILRMGGLRNSWDEMAFLALQRGLSRLVSPFSDIDGFKIRISAPSTYGKFSKNIEPPQSIKYPHYTVSGKINADGSFKLIYTVVAEGNPIPLTGRLVSTPDGRWELLGESNLPDEENFRAPECGPLDIELRIWDRDDLGNIVQMIKSSISNVRKDLDSFAGVNIYRDGFRVLPYGEPNNDWLRLDLRRVQNPTLRLSNNQIFGYVQITADGNPELKDQSNREGLRESQAYYDLREIMITILSRMETYRRQYKKKENQGDTKNAPSNKPGLFDPISFDGIKSHLSDNHPSDKVAFEMVQQVEKDFAQRLGELKQVVARYHGLATLGQLIDGLLHQGRHPLSKIVGYAKLGLDSVTREISKSVEKINLASTLERFEKILKQGQVLDGVFKRIEPFGGRRRGRPAQLYMEQLIKDSQELLSDDFVKLKVKFTLSDTQTLVKVDSAELQEVFINLMQNSLYWLSFVPEHARIIAATVRRNPDTSVEIILADSGPGVPWENRESIFEPYFSTKSDGVGLGLSIVGDIVSDYYGGSLELMETNSLGGAAFRITLRRRV
ncbi:sensor histidine kinase [Pseudomonas veronii]|uniref:sensor histidine kinase n=1 Tax=Pseudomonas veronii TaxID=76761 RepID=UPI0026589589|nr:ATP-binding protein [Pseudomonas veronii]WKC44096.1 ATP-binding protein [Pseudomonas veronii]